MSGRTESARAALRRVKYLAPDLHDDIIKELDGEALLDNPRRSNGGSVRATAADAALDQNTFIGELRGGAVRTMMAAAEADKRNVELLRQVHANARRLGVAALFADYSKPIDVDALNVALRGRPESWRFKDMLYSLRLIPA